MPFIPPISIGEVITNGQLSDIFKVGNMGGMRRSKSTGTLVLISDNTKGLYHDQWHDGRLLYTGMGKVGDQVLEGNQNKTLAESNTNGVKVYLFEVNTPGQYTFTGRVQLAAKPYQEIQPDDNGNDRKVWIFPLEKATESTVLHESDHYGDFDSWTIVDDNTAIKHCDKSFYDYNGSGVPKGISWFFGADNLELGQVIRLKLLYQGHEYEGLVRNESSDRRRVRIFWNADLGRLFDGYREKEGSMATFHRVGDNTFEVTMKGDEAEVKVSEKVNQIKNYIGGKGFTYPDGLIENFYLSLKSKPFVILAGTSGTGKTRLVRLFAEAIGANEKNQQYKQVAVRPDWSDSTDLFGHVDLNGTFVPGTIIDFLAEAQRNPDHPYVLCLDEMNLARVEYYLSDFLSVIETRDFVGGHIKSDPLVRLEQYGTDEAARKKYGEIFFPENLYVIGTVNMDETTFPFSRKVLDRANTIEFNYVDLLPDYAGSVEATCLFEKNEFLKTEVLKLAECAEEDQDYIIGICKRLQDINGILQKANAHVGYRVRDEICFYMLNNRKAGLLTDDDALDNEIMQKILPRIQGSGISVKEMLCELFIKILAKDYDNPDGDAIGMQMILNKKDGVRYPRSAAKVMFMVRRFEEDGFTSYWL